MPWLPALIHCDIKSSSILLDLEFGAKIVDFGLARTWVKAGEPHFSSSICIRQIKIKNVFADWETCAFPLQNAGIWWRLMRRFDLYSFSKVLDWRDLWTTRILREICGLTETIDTLHKNWSVVEASMKHVWLGTLTWLNCRRWEEFEENCELWSGYR